MHTNSMGKKSFSNPFKPCEGRKWVMEAVWSWGPGRARGRRRCSWEPSGHVHPRPLQVLPCSSSHLPFRSHCPCVWLRAGAQVLRPPPPTPRSRCTREGAHEGPRAAANQGSDAEAAQVQVQVQGPRGSAASCGPAHPPPAAVRRCEGARGGPRAGGGGIQAAPSPPTRRCRSAAGSGPRRALHPPGGPGSAGGAPREAAVACRAPEGLPRGASPPAAGKAPRPPPPSAPGAPRARRTPAVGSLGWSRAGRGGAGCRAPGAPGRRLGLPAQGGPLRAASPEKPQASPGAGPRAPAGAPRRSLAGPGGLRGGRGGFSASPGAAPGSRAGTRGSLGRSSVLEPAARRLC